MLKNTYTVAFTISVVLHIALAAVLLLGDFSEETDKPKPSAVIIQPIKAVVVDSQKVAAQVKRLQQKKLKEAKRIRDLEDRAEAAKRKRTKEEKQLKNLEKQRKKKLAEKKVADAAASKANAQAKAADIARKKKLQEKKVAEQAAADAKAKRLKEEQAAKKAEQLRKQKKAERLRKQQAAKEKAEQEKLLEQQMAEEMANRQQARRQQQMTEIGRFTALIKQTIRGNLITDRSTMEGKSCKLTISLAPSGFVTNVVINQGDKIMCAAAKTSIYKAGSLPVSKDPEIFKEMSKISLTVEPEF